MTFRAGKLGAQKWLDWLEAECARGVMARHSRTEVLRQDSTGKRK